MAKTARFPGIGSCIDCQDFFECSDGPYRGECLRYGKSVSNIDACCNHDCFLLAKWWVSREESENKKEKKHVHDQS